MHLIVLSVTDLELMAAQAVKIILLTILIIACFIHILGIYHGKTYKRKFWKGTLAVLFIGLALPVYQWILIEGSLLNSTEYTIGTTLGMCQVFARGKGIEFEYMIGAKKYVNCDVFHPLTLDSLIVPNGKYYVRYSNKYPDKGRIDFNKPIMLWK